ncbi:MAG: NUDIX domain-containing protein [Rhodobiaceae bacterium]|nr:NUDIX domain-containing protein [Rhodobiaceae bacterium]
MRFSYILFPVFRFFARIYWRLVRPLTAGARVLVFDDEGRVLLVRHTYMPGWFLPGGGVDRGETMKAAAIRELYEEVGVTPEGDLSFFGLYANFREHKSDHVALFVLRSFQHVPNPNQEIAESGFFAPDALPDATTDATRVRIREVIGNLPAAEFWSAP